MTDERERPLRRGDLDPDPLAQLRRWFEDAVAAGIPQPEAAALATAGPSVRMVLVKAFEERGLVFATGHGSRKARELDAEPRAALLFHWHALGRQVRVEGAVARTSDAESDALHAARPRGSQVAAWASRQSEPLSGRSELEAEVERLARELPEPAPRPPHWGGYRLTPGAWEFWQHRGNRLHDRFAYVRDGQAWCVQRLAP